MRAVIGCGGGGGIAKACNDCKLTGKYTSGSCSTHHITLFPHFGV